MKREYWLDDEGKLNYTTHVAYDPEGKHLEMQKTGKLTKAIEHH